MLHRNYNNFVRPTSLDIISSSSIKIPGKVLLSGEEAKQLYLNEIKDGKSVASQNKCARETTKKRQSERRIRDIDISDKDLFMCVQNDDVDTLKLALDACPDNINKRDDYGWSLLMIACQASSIESVKELLKRGVDTSVRDKAGNSAQSLIIKNKNYILADLLISNKPNFKDIKIKTKNKKDKKDQSDLYFCDLCNTQDSSKEYHLSSTVHNLNLSKGRKLPSNYIIPESNKGYQIMLKVGWDKESGLGPDGMGKKYPIKSVQKQDRKGLGHGKRALKVDKEEQSTETRTKKIAVRERESSKNMEKNFRRQFY